MTDRVLKGARGKASWANAAAKNDLIAEHPDHFDELLNMRRKEVGLPPLGLGASKIRRENDMLRAQVETFENELAVLRAHLNKSGPEFTQ